MGYVKDAQGNIIGQTPDPWDTVAPPQQQPAPNPAGFQGVGGAGNAPAPAAAPPTAAPQGAGGQPGFVPAVASDADLAAARADIERRRQAAAANRPPPTGPSAVGVEAPQQPGMGGLGRVIGYSGGAPAHFEQAGNYYRGTPEQKQAIMGVLGANADRIQAQGDASAAELQHLERINSAADIEALKARKANQAQGIIDEMEASDRAEANQAVREAIDKHASMAAPDPAKYWGGLGFAGSVGMILADSLDRIGSSMKGEKPSNLIERGIERSLQQQQAALDKSRADITQAQGLYAQMRQSGMDKEHAFQAAKARRMEDAAGIIDSYQRQARLPQVKQQLAMQAADLRERAGASFLQLSESIAGQGKGRQVAAQGGAPIYAGGDIKQRTAIAAMLKAEAEARKAGREASGDLNPLKFGERKALQKELTDLEIANEKLTKAKGVLPSWTQKAAAATADAIPAWAVGIPAAGLALGAAKYGLNSMRPTSEQEAKLEETKMAIGSLEPGTKTELDMARYAKQAGHTGLETYSKATAEKLHDEMIARNAARMRAVRAALSTGQVTETESRRRQESTRDNLRGK